MNLMNGLILIENIQAAKTNEGSWSSILSMLGQFFLLIIVFLLIIFLSYYFTKLIGKFRYNNNKNSNIRIIESVAVGYQASIQLIKVGDKTILVGVTKERVEFICDVNENSIDLRVNNIKLPDTFQKYLKNFMDKNHDKNEK